MIFQLHHVGILTSDLEAMSARLTDILGLPAAQARSVVTDRYSLRTAMIPIGNGTHVQLIEPAPGDAVKDLADRGDGALVEIAFHVRDAESAASQIRRQGLTPTDFGGAPLMNGFATAASGNRYLYLPAGAVMASRVELIQPMN